MDCNLVGSFAFVPWPHAAEERPIDVIEDNSFLIEEAYNQEPGVVQHIFNAVVHDERSTARMAIQFHAGMAGLFPRTSVLIYDSVGPSDRRARPHLRYRRYAAQLSLPGAGRGEFKPAFAPRFSLNPADRQPRSRHRQWRGRLSMGASFQQELGPRFATNANLGVTYLPGVRERLGGSTGPLSPRHSLVSI